MSQDVVAGQDPADEHTNRKRLRTVRLIVIGNLIALQVLLLCVALLEAAMLAEGSALRLMMMFLFMVPSVLVFLPMYRSRMEGRDTPEPWLFWGSFTCVVVAHLLAQSPFTAMLTLASWWAICVVLAPRRLAVVISVVCALLPWALLGTFLPETYYLAAYVFFWFLLAGWGVFMACVMLTFLWLWDVTREAVLGQRARSRLAVSEERLRFARDMHDLLGHSLSALAVKAQLAARLAESAPERSAAEIVEVRALARESLQQVRAVVRGYQEADLPEEIDAVRGVLEANGTRLEVMGAEGLELPQTTAALVAWVVREGATNVLRHSDATVCRIGFTLTRDAFAGSKMLVVEVGNDRARGDGEKSSGSGLAGLSERVSMVGGTFSAAPTRGGGFLLRAVLPLWARE